MPEGIVLLKIYVATAQCVCAFAFAKCCGLWRLAVPMNRIANDFSLEAFKRVLEEKIFNFSASDMKD
jgi:hypothetical protein